MAIMYTGLFQGSSGIMLATRNTLSGVRYCRKVCINLFYIQDHRNITPFYVHKNKI
jgi:hypothetical protein